MMSTRTVAFIYKNFLRRLALKNESLKYLRVVFFFHLIVWYPCQWSEQLLETFCKCCMGIFCRPTFLFMICFMQPRFCWLALLGQGCKNVFKSLKDWGMDIARRWNGRTLRSSKSYARLPSIILRASRSVGTNTNMRQLAWIESRQQDSYCTGRMYKGRQRERR